MMAFKELSFLFKILPFLLSGAALKAAIIKPLDELNVIEVPVSKDSLTRISIKDDRILHVVGGIDDYVLEADETRGQVFIRPSMFASGSKPIHLSLVTEAGYTQDLRLIPRDQRPETFILIKPSERKSNFMRESASSTFVAREEVRTLLQACREGRIPLKYTRVPVPFSSKIRGDVVAPLKLLHAPGSTKNTGYTLITHLKGASGESGYLHGLTYEIRNSTNQPLVLSEDYFAKQFKHASSKSASQILAILMPQKTISPYEGARIYVVVQSFE